MSNLYVRSTTGSDANGGSGWSQAKATTTSAVSIDVAGDTLFYSQLHAESASAAITFAIAGTLSTPSRVLCANDAAEPPTALANTATVTTTGASTIMFLGSFYMYGLTFNAGDAANAANINLVASTGTAEAQIAEQCNFVLPNTSATSVVLIGHLTSSVSHRALWKDCGLKLGHASQRIQVSAADFVWRGGSALAGTSTPTAGLIQNAGTGRAGTSTIEGVDLSNFSSSLALVSSSGLPGRVLFRNCKLPAGWAGALFNAAPTIPGLRAELHNCDSGDTNYRLHVEDMAGSIKSETTIIKTGGASDGTTGFSWKMASSATANALTVPLESPGLPALWNATVGSPVTVTVDTLLDSAAGLTDGDIWLEVQYLGTSGVPLAKFSSDARASVLAAGAAQDASAATWTTTGLTTPNKQKLVVTFTPQKAGYLQAKVMLAKPSTTVYVDPKLQVS